jgi:polyisoprenoid-binding protein YceI
MAEKIPSKWAIDAAHSEIRFKIKHLAITNVNGTFDVFQGSISSEHDDFDQAVVQFEMDADSINTNNPNRDGHLKSADLFNTQVYPRIRFDGFLDKKDDGYELSGDLTICAVKKPVTLKTEFSGIATGRFNDIRAGFEAAGKINRRDFGLTWNVFTEAGGLVVGEEVQLQFDIQLIKQ